MWYSSPVPSTKLLKPLEVLGVRGAPCVICNKPFSITPGFILRWLLLWAPKYPKDVAGC